MTRQENDAAGQIKRALHSGGTPPLRTSNSDNLTELQHRKLSEEVKQLRRPFYKKSAFWFGVVTTVCAVGGLTVQILSQPTVRPDPGPAPENFESLVRELREYGGQAEINLVEQTVTSIKVADNSVSPNQAARIGEILRALHDGHLLSKVSVNGPRVDDALVRELQIADLHKLRSLDLSATSITDATLAQLTGLERIEELILSNTSISNQGLAYLSDLESLRVLSISPARDLPKDQRLIDDDGLRHLARLSQLKSLRLRNRKASIVEDLLILDEDQTTYFESDHYAITDKGLRHFIGLNHLETLDLTGAQVTRAGSDELRSKLPRLKHFFPLFELPSSIRIGADGPIKIKLN